MFTDLPGWAQTAANIGLAIAAVAAGAFGYFQSKRGKESGETDLTVLGIDDVTSNRVVKKALDTQEKTAQALISLAADVKLMVEHLIARDEAADQDAEIERRVQERLGRGGKPQQRSTSPMRAHNDG